MFTSPRPNLYVSDAGFSVEVMGRFGGLVYREGSREMRVDAEFLSDTSVSALMLYRDSIKEWIQEGHAGPVVDADRDRVVENIRSAFRFQGFEIEVV